MELLLAHEFYTAIIWLTSTEVTQRGKPEEVEGKSNSAVLKQSLVECFFLSATLEKLWSISVQQVPVDTDSHWY